MVRSYELGVLITDPARVKLPYDYPVVKWVFTFERSQANGLAIAYK